MLYFVAYHYERRELGGKRVGFGNCLQRFDFHPLTDPKRAGTEIDAAQGGNGLVILLNVQPVPGSEF